MSMVPPTPQKRTFWQGLGDLLRDPQFMSGLQNFSVGMTEHPDPGFHARQGLAINQNLLDTEEQRFRQREHVEAKQAEARRQAFVNQMMAPPPGPSQQQRASGVDPTYRPPGMAPAPQGPTGGMAPSQQQYIQQLARVDPAAALKLVTQHQFREPAKAPEPVYQKGQDGRLYLMNPPSGGTPQPAIPGVGPKPPEKPSERDKKVAQYMTNYGMSRGDAIKLADNKKKVVSDSEYGGYHIVDMVTGKSTYHPPVGSTGQAGDSRSPVTKKEREAYTTELKAVNRALDTIKQFRGAIEGGVGAVPAGQAAVSGLVGQAQDLGGELPLVGDLIPEEPVFPGVKKKRSGLAMIDKAIMKALLANPRAPIFEQQKLAEDWSLSSKMLDEGGAEDILDTVEEHLETRRSAAEKVVGGESSGEMNVRPDFSVNQFQNMTEAEMRDIDTSTLTPAEIDILEALWEAKGYGR